jgi:hypothetical protein
MKLPTNHRRRFPLVRGSAVIALIAFGASSLWAQAVPTVTPEDMAKYDTNRNGRLDPEELAAKQAAEASNARDELITLSPFEVKAETVGYFQSNTMSGTRLNSKIEDLGQSITVMTKEQMFDFAMLDINDVFDYMAGTEGTNTYSDFEVDRTGEVRDNVSLNPNNANRVRGIGNANIAFNNIATTGRVPVDRLWLDSLELSRGPNANIFGLGNSAGTVNQVPATANLSRNFARVEGRADSDGGWRTSLDVNRVLLKDKLSVRGSFAYQHNAFVRKPSGEDMRRRSLQIKAQPFEKTTVSLSWYGYNNTSRRPNFTTPRDNVSGWIAAGRPAWDPVTRLITVNGVTYGQGTGGTLAAGSTTPITTLPDYFDNSPSDGRSFMRIGRPGEAPHWTIPTVSNLANYSLTNPLGSGINNNIRFVRTGFVNSYGIAQPLFQTYAALSDKSIYNWEKHSLTSANKAWDDVDMYLAQLDQVFINTSKHTLASRFAFMRENAKRLEDLPLGPPSVNGVIGEIYYDPNTRNLDGTPNPYFGRPYVRTKEHYFRERPQHWDTAQAQLAYRLDFSRDSGWTKWLGTQQLLGYYEHKDRESRHYTWRRTNTGLDHPWQTDQFNAGIPPSVRSARHGYPSSNNFLRVYEFYYLGDTPGGGVEYGPARFEAGTTVPLVYGNTGGFRYDPVRIDYTPNPESGGNANEQVVVKTAGAVIQSFFLDGRLVTTFGRRQDKVFDRSGVDTRLTPDFTSFDYAVSDQWKDGSTWRLARGVTTTRGAVVRPFRDWGFLSDQASRGSGLGRFAAEAVRGLSLTYNRSDNFIPQGPAFDLFLNRLPNQTGLSEDYGFWVGLLGGRLSMRYNYFETNQINLRKGDINTIAQRVLRHDGLNANDAWNLRSRATDWVTELNPGWTSQQVEAEVAKIMGLSQEQIDGLLNAIATGTLAATQDVVAKGHELELNFNPTRHWTISGSVTKTEAINQNAGSTIEDWINMRMPIWESVEDPRFPDPNRPGRNMLWRYLAGAPFNTFGYHGTQSAATNYVPFIEGPLAVYRQLEGRPRPQMAKYAARFSTRYQLAGITEHSILRNMNVGGAVRWNDKKAIGFYGVQSLPAMITALDPNKPVYTPAETYVDLFVSYRTRLFSDRVRANFQLNVKNVGEKGGGLLPTAVFPDGSPLAYRIIDPRQFIFSASFDL